MFISIPTYKDGEWVENTHFETREQFRDFLLPLFKEPGQYGFDEQSLIFNEQAKIFEQQKYYCAAPMGTKDYIRYWDREKEKCRRGLLVHSGEKIWYLTRDYYMWLNFLPIFNKEEARFGFAKIRDAQYHMALYEILAELHYKHCAIVKKRQIASEQPHSEPVLGERGWTTMGDIQPGDKLWNPDGTLTTILHKSNNGPSEVYEFEFGDGRKTRCGIEHNWEVYDRVNNKRVVLNTRQLLDNGILRSPVKGVKKTYDNYRFAIDTCEPVPFINHEELPIDPYVLGCILGDGHINKTVYIAGKDKEIFEEIQLSLGSDYELVNNGYCKKLIKYKKRFSEDCLKYNNGKYGCNPLLRALDELGLRKDNKGIKHIPEIYKHSGIEDRIALLQGLMDTDGYINAQGNNIHFTNTNRQLIDDVAYVARSLGLKVSITEKDNGRQNKFYRLLFSGEISIELFRLTRKQNRLVKRFGKKTFNLIPLVSIEKLDYLEESSCIVVDNPNHLYITRDFIVTHNSYFHAAKLINMLWFEEGATLKMGASWKDYINEKGTWKFIEEYESFLNSNTAWYRPMNPRKILMWQQKIEIESSIGGKKRKSEKGLKGTLQGMSFEKDPTNGVGGPCAIFFHEEGGIAPKADQTYEYIRPALKSGFIYTGIFIIAGSVGDLDQCGPLKEFMLRPDPNDMYAVESNLVTNNGLRGRSALFIPEHWSMPPYIDEYGNSLIEESLKALEDQYAIWKRELSPEVYQLRISQHPRTLEEAFAARTHSKFPQHLIAHQELKIQNKDYPYEFVDLSYDANENIIVTTTNKLPISDFPVDKKMEDKSGSIVVWERPDKNAPFATYYASIDPVSQGRAEHVDNMIYTPTGKKRIGDIKIGDLVISDNGQPAKVTGVFPQGKKELYRVTLNDGFSVLVCREHLWAVKASDEDRIGYHILSVDQLLNKELQITHTGVGSNFHKKYSTRTYYKKSKDANKWKIPIAKPIEFSSIEQPINPYLLGLLLGDGGFSQRGIRFTTADIELVDNISKILPENLSIRHINAYDYRIRTDLPRNPLTKKLRDLGLQGLKSKDKFIPESYLVGSVEDRLSLLQGLMDADGYCGNAGAEFYSISEKLANGVVELCHSLGGLAKIRKKITNRKVRNGVGYVYVVRVILPEQFNPFRLTRKAVLYKPTYRFSRYISDISFEKIDEAVCIQVESPTHLYLTEHAIVTHNTTTSESLCSIYIYKNPIEISTVSAAGTETRVERDKIVAAWCGRFEDINKTHMRLQMMIEWYNAWTLVENNVSLFIQHMIDKKKQKYLVPKNQVAFFKDIQTTNTYQEYGWRNTGRIFYDHLLSYGIEFLKEEIETITKPDGEIVKRIFGIERIPDPMLLKEMKDYQEDLNVDRLVSFCALIAFAKIQQANRGYGKKVEYKDKALEPSDKFSKLSMSPFRHLGGNNGLKGGQRPARNPYKNLR